MTIPLVLPPAPVDPGSGALVSVGIDLTSVDDVRQSLHDFGERFLQRVFTSAELADCSISRDPAPRLAARFAAKEATIKALKVDGPQPPWTSMAVRRHPSGWCDMQLTGPAARLAEERGIGALAVSLSHDGDIAAAIVVATAPPEAGQAGLP